MNRVSNPELKKQAIFYALFTAAAAGGGACISRSCAAYVFAVCMAGGGAFYIFTRRRYGRIQALSCCLEQILHGDYSMGLIENQEGELAILGSEIYKMTVMLREQAQILQTDKNYLSNSIADISHQLRTPLTSIRMLLPRLGREQTSRDDKLQMMQDMNRLLARIEWLISTLLKISRLESGTVEFAGKPVSVKSLADRAMESLEIPMELRGIDIQYHIPDQCSCRVDAQWTVEALENILKNSMEHTPAGGTVSITAAENPVYTEIIISDSGPGFLPEDLPHLFERFYKGTCSGSHNCGIGLALAQMIVSGQDGTILAANKEGGGAEFQIRFFNL